MVSMLTYQMTPLSRLWWKVWIFITVFVIVNLSNSGFRALSNGLPQDGIDREQLLSLQQLVSTSAEGKEARHESFREQYKRYKESYVKHLRFDPGKPDLSKLWLTRLNWHVCFSASVIEHAPLEAVYIFFDTATFDEIERDVKVGPLQNQIMKYNSSRNLLKVW